MTCGLKKLGLDVMRVGFAGTPEFAKLALQAILEAGFNVPLVLTQPDRPSGRGLKLTPSAVKQLALEHHLPVIQPRSLRLDGKYPEDAAAAQESLQQAQLDVLVVAAYGLILPAWVLNTPSFGCLNIHGSLLPRWRGAAPIQRAIEAGDTQTGVTIMQMDEGLDTGAMLLKESLTIAADDTTASLHDKLAAMGGRLIVEALARLEQGALPATPQPQEGITYAAKIAKEEAALDFSLPAVTLDRRIRAFNPFPGALAHMGATAVKIWRASPVEGQGQPGTVLAADAAGVVVACGEGALLLTELQKPGGKRLPAEQFLQGFALSAGQRFELAA